MFSHEEVIRVQLSVRADEKNEHNEKKTPEAFNEIDRIEVLTENTRD